MTRSFLLMLLKACRIIAIIAATLPIEVRAQSATLHALEKIGQVVEVREYPVKQGSLDSFGRRRQEAAAVATAEAQASLGIPLFREVRSETDLRLVYPRSLVVITGRYSNGIICRVDVPVAGLDAGFSEETVVELATRKCRVSEEKAWGTSGFTATDPIGSEKLQQVPGGIARVYATDELHSLFSNLVREIEIGAVTQASLIRGKNRDEEFQRDGTWQWRYAWFANGEMLAVRYQSRFVFGRPDVGLACAITAPSKALSDLENGEFSQWCNRQVERLKPSLDRYVEAVGKFRSSDQQNRSDEGIAPYGGFHQWPLPSLITAEFWKTGRLHDPKL